MPTIATRARNATTLGPARRVRRNGAPTTRGRERSHLTLAFQSTVDTADLPTRAAFARIASSALERDAAVTLRVVDGREARALNRRYRGRDYATNVLTFVYDDDVSLTGDIVLCAPVIAKEARSQHKTLRAHYAHLVIHGMLHLQGYGHERDGDAARMEAREIALLRTLGYDNPYGDA
jgi:probable rRNA maturation factor